MKTILIAIFAIVCVGAESLNAATIVNADASLTPNEVKQSTFIASGGNRAGRRTSDGSGLSDATIVETGDSVPGIWPSHSNTTANPATMWLSTNAAGGSSEGAEWVMYDLGAEYLLGGLHQWNYNESGAALGNGIQDVTIKFATSSAGFDAGNQGHASWGSDFATTFAIAPGLNTYTGETINFDSPRTARYVLLDTATTWGATYNRTGLSEIRFITAEPVPEPSTIALSVVGLLALVGLMKLRKKS